MSPEPSKTEGTPKLADPSKAEVAVEQDPLEDCPPSYEVNENLERQPDATEEDWRLGSLLAGEAPCPEDWATRFEPNLILSMTPKLNITDWIRGWFKTVPEHHWYAGLHVNAKNIPGLMRDGFHWSSANIIPGRGFILLNSRDFLKDMGFGCAKCKHTRTYKLKGNENTDTEWRGTLYVCAKRTSPVINFDLNWLTQDKTTHVTAYDWNSKPVYSYNWFRPSRNFNVVYEGMLLEGWWPWPKAALPS